MAKRSLKRPVLTIPQLRELIRSKEEEILKASPIDKLDQMRARIKEMDALRRSLDNALLKLYDAGQREVFRDKAKAKNVWVVEILEEEGRVEE
jgi:hypothetical protein